MENLDIGNLVRGINVNEGQKNTCPKIFTIISLRNK